MSRSASPCSRARCRRGRRGSPCSSTRSRWLPTYAYAQARIRGGTLATLVVGAALGVQHVALPFLPAWTFVEWRALMWVPYGLVMVGLLARRLHWLPWLAVAHGLVHAAAAVLVWRASI